jgi:hypothetical protein
MKMNFQPPAKTPELRKKQLEQGTVPEYGRGACGGQSPLPHGAAWVPHVGKQQRVRIFTQSWNQFEKICKVDDEYRQVAEQLLDWIEETKIEAPELVAKAVVHAALIQSKAIDSDWAYEVISAVDRWKAAKPEETPSE